jgi:hypothetical protein
VDANRKLLLVDNGRTAQLGKPSADESNVALIGYHERIAIAMLSSTGIGL